MKKSFAALFALLLVAGTTFVPNASAQTTKPTKKTTARPNAGPPVPDCPYNDPNGCNIFG